MLAPQLHRVQEGRLFVRAATAQTAYGAEHRADVSLIRAPAMVFGVVKLPLGVDLERMHTARLNDALWLDIETCRRPTTPYERESDFTEHPISSLLTTLHWRRGVLPDAMELFLRRTHLPRDRDGMQWGYVAGVTAVRPAAMPRDGLYELAGAEAGLRLVSAEPYSGSTPSTIFRECLWGPKGAFGLSTDLGVPSFAEWVAADRERTKRGDPMFAEFVKRMDEHVPMPMYYTAEQKASRDELARTVLAGIQSELAGPVAAEASRRRPRP